jgi:hypothetical protein
MGGSQPWRSAHGGSLAQSLHHGGVTLLLGPHVLADAPSADAPPGQRQANLGGPKVRGHGHRRDEGRAGAGNSSPAASALLKGSVEAVLARGAQGDLHGEATTGRRSGGEAAVHGFGEAASDGEAESEPGLATVVQMLQRREYGP